MIKVNTPQSRCKASVVRCDITPPVGIYHRMWGAALHDQATGVHRSLEATLLWLEPTTPATGKPQIIISLDHCILDGQEIHIIRQSITDATGVPYGSILVTLTHTHGSGWMSRTRSHLPGGEKIGPYLDTMTQKIIQLARKAKGEIQEAVIVYGNGHCDLAAHRDFLDESQNRIVCGYNPDGQADDTVMLASIRDSQGGILATLVNYACHPTTLAWQNTLISPDWVGAMRETVEKSLGGLCLFLQGASGDLGPREGFVGETEVADRNGRQLGFAALSGLTAMPPAGTEFRYTGSVTSGTMIGTWKNVSLSTSELDQKTYWSWEEFTVDLPYRHDLPTIESTTASRVNWQAEEAKARDNGDELRVRDCRAQVEQCTRQLTRLNALVKGKFYPLPVHLGRMGDAIWIFVPGELYQMFQLTLRKRLAPHPVIVSTLTNDWQPGYIPPAETYGYGIYQEVIAATSPGCLEILTEEILRRINGMKKMTRK